ncbi:porin [Aminobacter sp. P9b]|uniref:porin n=1 Tax=Aminobacter sp. P9b TaxID=3133697 RepID=UPI00324EC7DE
MNIKSLLLGSAAALLAVSGARAADAVVVAEPEPMEYVRICDVYGAGFYYIPGTETCLKIGGFVRYQIDFDSRDDERGEAVFGDENGGWRKYARANVHLDARSETEYGTFKRYIELEATVRSNRDDWAEYTEVGGGDGFTAFVDDRAVRVNYAYIELGGLYIGFGDSLFDQGIKGEFDSNFAFDDSVHRISYSFDAGNGIALTAALEELDYNYDYVPNILGKVSVSQGWGSVDIHAAYDATAEEFALKGIVGIKATDALTVNLLAIYASDPNVYWAASEWSLGGSLTYQVNEKLALTGGAQWFGDVNPAGDDRYSIGANIDYTVVENLTTKLAVNYVDGDNMDGRWNGFLRIQAGF